MISFLLQLCFHDPCTVIQIFLNHALGIPGIIINGLNEKSCFLCVHLRNLSFALILLTFSFVLRDLDIMRNEETV